MCIKHCFTKTVCYLFLWMDDVVYDDVLYDDVLYDNVMYDDVLCDQEEKLRLAAAALQCLPLLIQKISSHPKNIIFVSF